MRRFHKESIRFKGSAILTCIYAILMISSMMCIIVVNNIIFNTKDNCVDTLGYIFAENRIHDIYYKDDYELDMYRQTICNDSFGMFIYEDDSYIDIISALSSFRRKFYFTRLDDGTIVITKMEVYGE